MDNFNHLYMCNYESSPLTNLVDKIVQYYKRTESASARDAAKEKQSLTAWWRSSGYSNDDYQQAKKIASGIRY